MRREAILALLAGSALPEGLKSYLAAALRRGRGFSFTQELKRDPEAFLASCGRLLGAASRALGRPGEELLFATGFGLANLAPHRLEAAFAELRAALFLHGQGFSCVELVGTCARPSADLSAEKDGLRWAFEVRCLSAEGELDAGLLAGKYQDKLPQAGAALKRRGFDRAAVVLVRGPLAPGTFRAEPALEALAAAALPAEKRKTAVRLCLLDRGRFGVSAAW
jgi:hypothetical protein